MKTRGIELAVMCAILAIGCSPFDGREEGAEEEGEAEGEVGVAILRLAFDASSRARSVHIRGARRTPADAKYACSAHFDACVDLATMDSSIRGLCPSVSLAPGAAEPSPSAWDFDFAVFEGASCSGAALLCYGAADLGVEGSANRIAGEILMPGPNTTQVICIVKAATQ